MPAPPKRPIPKPVRQVGVITAVEDWLRNGDHDRIEAQVNNSRVECRLDANDLTAQLAPGQTIVLFNSAPKHPTPFLVPALNRVFMLVQKERPPVVYLFRRYNGAPDLRPVTPNTYPYN